MLDVLASSLIERGAPRSCHLRYEHAPDAPPVLFTVE
jgi:hypothetical protein